MQGLEEKKVEKQEAGFAAEPLFYSNFIAAIEDDFKTVTTHKLLQQKLQEVLLAPITNQMRRLSVNQNDQVCNDNGQEYVIAELLTLIHEQKTKSEALTGLSTQLMQSLRVAMNRLEQDVINMLRIGQRSLVQKHLHVLAQQPPVIITATQKYSTHEAKPQPLFSTNFIRQLNEKVVRITRQAGSFQKNLAEKLFNPILDKLGRLAIDGQHNIFCQNEAGDGVYELFDLIAEKKEFFANTYVKANIFKKEMVLLLRATFDQIENDIRQMLRISQKGWVTKNNLKFDEVKIARVPVSDLKC